MRRSCKRCCSASIQTVFSIHSMINSLQNFCLLTQHEFLDFSGRCFRYFLKNDMPRAFEMGQQCAAMVDYFFSRCCMAGLQFDEGTGRFSPFVIRPCHHGCGLDAGMTIERILDFN